MSESDTACKMPLDGTVRSPEGRTPSFHLFGTRPFQLIGITVWSLLGSNDVDSRIGFLLHQLIRLVFLCVAIIWGVLQFAPLLESREGDTITDPSPNAPARYGLSLADRQAVFLEIAQAEVNRIARLKKSRRRGHALAGRAASLEHRTLLRIANRRGLHVSIMYAILQEGIENHWVGAKVAEPLKPHRMF